MRVLMISADRSKRGILYPDTPAFKRQEAYAKQLGQLDIIAFSLPRDTATPISRGPLRIYPTNSASRLLHAWYARRIAKTLPTPDVVTAQDPFETGLVAWLIARSQNIPLHIQVHTDFLSPEYARLSLLNRLRVWIAGPILRRATGIRVVSDRVKRAIEKRFRPAAPIAILPMYADLERIMHAEVSVDAVERFGRFRTKILVVSRLEPEKNVGLAVRAFAKTVPQDACLIIVGEGSEKTSLQHFAKRLNVADRIYFEDAAEIGTCYKLADLVLVPSKYEGYGLVIVEALAAGKPVLSTDVGIAREAGAIVTTEDKFADSLAQWFKSGPREGVLKIQPYKNFDEYVGAYCDDIKRCANDK